MVVEIDDETKSQVIQMFSNMDEDVELHVFLKEHDCLYCNDTFAIAEMVAGLSEKINVIRHEEPLGQGLPKEMGIRFNPAIVVHGKEPYKIRFYGIPAGHEFGALVGTILDASIGITPLQPHIVEEIKAIDEGVHIQVFTTPQCPYCPDMVRLAHQAAMLNPKIESDMIESLEFRELAERYEVFGVPKTIINETVSVEGLTPPELFLDKLYEAID